MFLQQVYKHNKWLFIVMILFITGQLFINFKRGLTFSPFFHYGMYSEVMHVKSAYGVFEIEVNGKKLQAKRFSPQQWDKIILPLNYYVSINTKSNPLYYNEIKRLMTKIQVSVNDINYVQPCNSKNFENWYQLYLHDILKEKVNTMDIQYHIYHYKSGKLIPADTISLLANLCS